MIARTFYRRRIIETWGRGVLKIARLMRKSRLESPTVPLRASAIVVTFRLPGETTGKTSDAVLRQLAGDPSLAVSQLAARLRESKLTVHRVIQTLRETGRQARVGTAKAGQWQVIG